MKKLITNTPSALDQRATFKFVLALAIAATLPCAALAQPAGDGDRLNQLAAQVSSNVAANPEAAGKILEEVVCGLPDDTRLHGAALLLQAAIDGLGTRPDSTAVLQLFNAALKCEPNAAVALVIVAASAAPDRVLDILQLALDATPAALAPAIAAAAASIVPSQFEAIRDLAAGSAPAFASRVAAAIQRVLASRGAGPGGFTGLSPIQGGANPANFRTRVLSPEETETRRSIPFSRSRTQLSAEQPPVVSPF